ncbi:MAG: hypothetical protein NZ533_07975 [Casimicrobiaceae bacterium]|nr:hypothetical protein [Casimicrobiaceae bacterium]MCX8099179.1 hypothetical protein [Casimicrobiaceae bacterium]MDW8312618.1 hypothetical protein [Burkholderiales bacterium]
MIYLSSLVFVLFVFFALVGFWRGLAALAVGFAAGELMHRLRARR